MTIFPFQLGPYRCLEQVGADELADVFRAELAGEAGFVKQYALKRFNERATALPDFVAGLTRDAQRNTTLGHGNIVRVVGVDKFDDTHVLVAEYVDGVSLRSLLERLRAQEDRVPWTLAAHLAIELGQALDHAHHGEPPTPHGALSPNHVMLTREGGVRILNFGLAWSLARSKNLIGKHAAEEYAYLAPEQIETSRPGALSDLFSLGVILYEMVTGQALFELAAGNRRRLIPSPMKALDSELEPIKPIVTRLLIKDPAKRFEGAGDVVEALQKLQHEKGQVVSSRPLVVWLEEVLRPASEARPDPSPGANAEVEFDDEVDTKVATFKQQVTEPKDLRPLASLSKSVPDLPEVDDGFQEDIVTREITGVDVQKALPSALPLPPLPDSPTAKELAPANLPGRPGEEPAEVEEPEEPTIEKPLMGYASRSKPTPKAEPDPAPKPEPKPEPEPEPEPTPESTPEPKYAPSDKRSTVTEPIRVSPPTRTGASKGIVFAIVALTALCLTSTGVAIFLYLELSKTRNPARASKSGNNATARPITPHTGMRPRPAPAMRPWQAPAMRPRPRPAMTARPMDSRPTPMATDTMAAAPMTPDPTEPTEPTKPPSGKPAAVRAVSRKGKPKAYELELFTAPQGVSVIYNNRLLGKTPIRLRAKSSKRYLLVLNKEGFKVKAIKPKFSRFVGLRHRVTLKATPYLARLGTEGQTRLDVHCRTANIYRVFLNGRDTGRNCPATLKVSRGPNAPGIYLPDKDRVTFRKIKSIPQQAVKVEFPY